MFDDQAFGHIVETLFDQCLGLIIHHLRFSRALYHRPTNMFFCFVQAHEALLHIYYRIKSRRERAERAERGVQGRAHGGNISLRLLYVRSTIELFLRS